MIIGITKFIRNHLYYLNKVEEGEKLIIHRGKKGRNIEISLYDNKKY